MTRVTAVIPLFHGARFVGETIGSLLAQTWPDFRLLCIDDASDDDSAAVARTAGGERITVLQNPARLGLGANWNRALETADTEYLLIAHQDDIYEPDYLATMVRLLDEHPRALAAHSRATTVDENGRLIPDPAGAFKDTFWSPAEPQEREPAEELAVLQRGNYVIAPSVLLRMSTVKQLGPFDARYGFVTDWEYWMRASLAGFTLVGTHARLVRFRRHAQTATRAQELTMQRYEEELALLTAFATHGQSRRPFLAIENTLLNDFVERLAAGDTEGARTLATFARERVPRFAGSRRDRVMRAALTGGAPAGRALQLARRAYIATSVRRGREPGR